MISLAYISVATHPMSDEAIGELLVQSRKDNRAAGITGCLLYHRGRFVQILEGDEDAVTEKYRKISYDPRHRGLHVLSRETVSKRQFALWTMGYQPLSREAASQLDGFEDFFNPTASERLKHVDNSAQLFLEWLSEYWFSVRNTV